MQRVGALMNDMMQDIRASEAMDRPHAMWSSSCVEDTKRMAEKLAAFVQAGDCIELSGDLGAGKTQFVQGLAAGLGISAQVISPTFNILLTYPGGRVPLFHFDLYRLDDALELEDIGFYDVLEDEGVVCIEWGDKFPDALPDDRLVVRLLRLDADADANARRIELFATGPRAGELLSRWEEACKEAREDALGKEAPEKDTYEEEALASDAASSQGIE